MATHQANRNMPERGNRRLCFDVVNHGRKTAMSYFNSAPRALDPTAPLDPGNGFLMRQGYTVVWCAWQADVPPTPGLMGLRAPKALGQGAARCYALFRGKINSA